MEKSKTLLFALAFFISSGSLFVPLHGQSSGGIDCLLQFQQDWLYCETESCTYSSATGSPFACVMTIIGCQDGALNAYSNCAPQQ